MMRVRKKTKVNHVAIVLDESGSMSSIRSKTIEVVNTLLQNLKDQSKNNKIATKLTFIKFDSNVDVVFSNVDVEDVLPLTYKDYNPSTYTALYDGVHEGIELLEQTPSFRTHDQSFLVMTITDGHENASMRCSASVLRKEIERLQKTDRWTFTFQVPPNYKDNLVRSLGVAEGNVQEWETSNAGLETASLGHTTGLKHYFTARNAGLNAVNSFYSNVPSTTQVKRALVDVSPLFKVLTASKEGQIRDIVEEKTKKPYQKGNAFYQLMKRELVQSYKELAVMDKKTNQIYAGTDARSLIGIPVNENAKVIPGNHGNFEIFVQSTSVNRAIPRGTKVLVKK